jgi:hypothetical protein
MTFKLQFVKQIDEDAIEDEYGDEVNLFEQFEFPVFMNCLAIYGDPQKCYGALHINSMNVGASPIELAYQIYNDGKFDAKRYAAALTAIYDRWCLARQTVDDEEEDEFQ